MPKLVLEQAVYGSFPFWHRGYDLLGSSEGCSPAWIRDFRLACQGYGEPPRNVRSIGGLFVQPTSDGARMIIQPSTQGADDHGRPSALAFHALFLSRAAYQRLQGQPFVLKPLFQNSWTPSDHRMPPLVWSGSSRATTSPCSEGELAELAAQALRRGMKLAIESDEPIDGLAAAVWDRLSARLRCKKTLATWIFCNNARFDLLAAPKLQGLEFDASYVLFTRGHTDLAWLRERLAVPARPSPSAWLSRLLPTSRTIRG